jgi:hypothetical protein
MDRLSGDARRRAGSRLQFVTASARPPSSARPQGPFRDPLGPRPGAPRWSIGVGRDHEFAGFYRHLIASISCHDIAQALDTTSTSAPRHSSRSTYESVMAGRVDRYCRCDPSSPGYWLSRTEGSTVSEAMDERHRLDRRERGTRLEARYLPAYKTERFNQPQSAELPRKERISRRSICYQISPYSGRQYPFIDGGGLDE